MLTGAERIDTADGKQIVKLYETTTTREQYTHAWRNELEKVPAKS